MAPKDAKRIFTSRVRAKIVKRAEGDALSEGLQLSFEPANRGLKIAPYNFVEKFLNGNWKTWCTKQLNRQNQKAINTMFYVYWPFPRHSLNTLLLARQAVKSTARNITEQTKEFICKTKQLLLRFIPQKHRWSEADNHLTIENSLNRQSSCVKDHEPLQKAL